VERRISGLLLMVVLAVGYAAYPAQVDVYFSPNGGCQDAVAAQLRAARTSIDVAVYSFTANRLASILDSAATRGVRVRVVTDRQQAGSDYSVAARPGRKFPLRIGAGGGYMHNKLAIIDDSVCITGSYNWSEVAETRNDENLLVLVSPELAKAYEARFELIWTYSSPASLLSPVTGEEQPAPERAKPAVSKPSSAAEPTRATGGSDEVYITRTGKKYHRAGCGYLSKSCIPISRKDAESRGYTPCSRCRP